MLHNGSSLPTCAYSQLICRLLTVSACITTTTCLNGSQFEKKCRHDCFVVHSLFLFVYGQKVITCCVRFADEGQSVGYV